MAGTTTQQEQAGIGELVSSAISDITTLVNDQIELTKVELKSSAENAGRAFGLLGAAAAVGGMFGLFLLITLAWVLVALGLPTWAGFGIVTLILLITAGILGFLGYKKMQKVQGPKTAMKELEATKAAFAGGGELPPGKSSY